MEIGMGSAPSPGKLLEMHSETAARGACPVAFHSKQTFTSAFGKVFYPEVRRHAYIREV